MLTDIKALEDPAKQAEQERLRKLNMADSVAESSSSAIAAREVQRAAAMRAALSGGAAPPPVAPGQSVTLAVRGKGSRRGASGATPDAKVPRSKARAVDSDSVAVSPATTTSKRSGKKAVAAMAVDTEDVELFSADANSKKDIPKTMEALIPFIMKFDYSPGSEIHGAMCLAA